MADYNCYAANSLTGGADGSLDSINGNDCTDKDLAFVITNDPYAYFYSLDDNSGAAESSPDVISPDSNAGDKRWVVAQLAIECGGTGASTAAAAFSALKQAATTSATGVVELATDAELATMTSDAVVCTPDNIGAVFQYETVWIPAAAMNNRETNGPLVIDTQEYSTNDVNVEALAFDGATEEYADFQFVFPEAWDRSTIKAKFYWTPGDSACSAGDTVEWQIAGQAISDDDALDVAFGDAGEVISDTVLAGKDGDLHITSATPAVTVGGTPALNDMIHFSVSRNVGGTDDMTEDAWLIGVLIQYKISNQVSAW